MIGVYNRIGVSLSVGVNEGNAVGELYGTSVNCGVPVGVFDGPGVSVESAEDERANARIGEPANCAEMNGISPMVIAPHASSTSPTLNGLYRKLFCLACLRPKTALPTRMISPA